MSCKKFIAESFALGTAVRLLHLSSKSYAEHEALGAFYDGQADLIDQYAEVYMGLESHVAEWPTVTLPKGRPTQLLEDYLLVLSAEKTEYESLKDILAEIETLTARTLYKLRNLK
jgi:hypothetical protein